MSHDHQTMSGQARKPSAWRDAWRSNWLSAGALWAVILAWAACGVWGWLQNAQGLMAIVTVAMTLGCQVFAARAVKNAADVESLPRRAALLGLAGLCLVFVGYSGKQGLETNEAQRLAPYASYVEAVERAKAAEAALAALPALAITDEAGRAIGPQRLAILAEQRAQEAARLQRAATIARAAVPQAVAKPAPPMPDWLPLAIVVLVEAIELVGFYAISRTRSAASTAQPDNVVPLSPGAALARQRWGKAPA